MLPEDVVPVRNMLCENEGLEHYLYLDSANPPQITVGIGHLLSTLTDAQLLPFLFTASNEAATKEQIADGWNTLKSQARTSGGKLTRYLGLYLPSQAIDDLLSADLIHFDAYLHATFKEFDSYPQNCRMACYDICYNVGSLVGFPKLRMAVVAKDWETAAVESHRQGIGDDRNTRTADLFKSALNPD